MITAMAILTECTRCGRFGPRGELPGHCTLCAPPPEVLETKRREVKKRHLKAVKDAKDGIAVPKREPRRPKAYPPVAALWRLVVSRRDTPAHLFAPGSDVTRSLCGTVTLRGPADPAPVGMRGCRRCALAAGWIESLSESVST